MTYTLTRSKRKTVALHICDGNIEVRAPLRMPKYAIDEFVTSKEKWIKKHLTRTQQQAHNRENFCLSYGDRIKILNESFVITENNEWLCSSPLGQNNEIYLKSGMTSEQIKAACIDLCRLIATGHLIFRTEELAKKNVSFSKQHKNKQRQIPMGQLLCQQRYQLLLAPYNGG